VAKYHRKPAPAATQRDNIDCDMVTSRFEPDLIFGHELGRSMGWVGLDRISVVFFSGVN